MEDLQGYFIEDLSLGMSARSAKTVTDADIVLFTGISGDLNPLHHDHEFARAMMFDGRIAPGMLTASLLSAVLGTKLPGPGAIYVSQSLRFLAPVRVGDRVEARVTVTDIMAAKTRAAFSTVCMVGDLVVLDGEALIMVRSRQAAAMPPKGAGPVLAQ